MIDFKRPINRSGGWLIQAHILAASLLSGPHTQAQTTLANPLVRPAPPVRDIATPPLPAGSPANQGRSTDGSVQAKSLQEEVNANLQRLNADRIPMPLRILLSTVYVSAIHGKTAILRQPLPPGQQALLAGQAVATLNSPMGALPGGAGFPGTAMPGMPGNTTGTMTGALPGAIPGALPGTTVPGAPLSPLSGGANLINPFASPPPRPTTLRVRDGEPISVQGFELTARIRDTEVTLLWTNPDERQTIVFQSSIESPSLPAYIPLGALLERPDSSYVNRSAPANTHTPGLGSNTATGSSNGTGNNPTGTR